MGPLNHVERCCADLPRLGKRMRGDGGRAFSSATITCASWEMNVAIDKDELPIWRRLSRTHSWNDDFSDGTSAAALRTTDGRLRENAEIPHVAVRYSLTSPIG